jgi:HSP20 family protein
VKFLQDSLFNCRCFVQAEEVQAKMENGVLTVNFPKAAVDQQPKRVNIA